MRRLRELHERSQLFRSCDEKAKVVLASTMRTKLSAIKNSVPQSHSVRAYGFVACTLSPLLEVSIDIVPILLGVRHGLSHRVGCDDHLCLDGEIRGPSECERFLKGDNRPAGHPTEPEIICYRRKRNEKREVEDVGIKQPEPPLVTRSLCLHLEQLRQSKRVKKGV